MLAINSVLFLRQILGLGGEAEFGGETVLVTAADNLVSDIDDEDDIIETQFVVPDNFANNGSYHNYIYSILSYLEFTCEPLQLGSGGGKGVERLPTNTEVPG